MKNTVEGVGEHMNPKICKCHADQYIDCITDISVGDLIQQEYWWVNSNGAYKGQPIKYAKVLAVGNEKVFVRHNDGSECAWTFCKRRWVRFQPRDILCYNKQTGHTEFVKEDVITNQFSILKTESGEVIIKE